MSRVQGTVKWFSNRKGFGFAQPDEGENDVFVHFSQIKADDGEFKTLIEGWRIEFEITEDDDGKLKAVNVTAPGGGVCTGPKRTRTRHERKEGEGPGGKKEGKGPRISHWHENLNDEVKASLDAKEIRHETGTVDISSGSVRIKLGTNGYTSAAHADGLLAEGTFESDDAGKITFTWKNALAFEGDTWIASDAASDKFPTTVSLGDDEVGAVGLEETPETLMGEAGKSDPKDALIATGFKMRRVVLTAKQKN